MTARHDRPRTEDPVDAMFAGWWRTTALPAGAYTRARVAARRVAAAGVPVEVVRRALESLAGTGGHLDERSLAEEVRRDGWVRTGDGRAGDHLLSGTRDPAAVFPLDGGYLLDGARLDLVLSGLRVCAEHAGVSPCHRARCGSVVLSGWDDPRPGEVLGVGANGPPGATVLPVCVKDSLPAGFRSERSCCVHAEQRAVHAALRDAPTRVPGSVVVFLRVGADGAPEPAGRPYCTMCSRVALDVGCAEFVLVHGPDLTGVTAYPATVYNALSYDPAGHVR